MPYYCTVPRCTSMAGKAKNVSFHQFPRDEELARLWNDILKRGKPYTKYSKVCSLHFKPDDYTITSVGKNKGQWRTLRKDAVPSQNLPSETPAPYSRKQWESWSQNSCTPSVMDPTIHQQMAQAIYMQTMLAMQAAGATEPPIQNGPLIPPDIALPHTSNQEDILKGKETNTDSTSYKCTECTKCFKDPDVFILHKRCHTRDIKTNGVEKENFNMNLTLRSNPILANLLKTNNEANFDPNMATMENLLMTALAANMDYIRNFTMIKEERDCDDLNERGEISHERGEMNHESGQINHDEGQINHDGGNVNRLHRDLSTSSREVQSKGVLDATVGDRDEIGSQNHLRRSLSIDKGELSYTQGISQSGGENHQRGDVNHLKGDLNQRGDVNHIKGDLNHMRGDVNRINHKKVHENHMKNNVNHHSSDQNTIGISYAMNFSTKVDKSSGKSHISNGFYRERYSEYDREINNPDGQTKTYDDNHSPSHYDDDVNESMDSNSLVIDETV